MFPFQGGDVDPANGSAQVELQSTRETRDAIDELKGLLGLDPQRDVFQVTKDFVHQRPDYHRPSHALAVEPSIQSKLILTMLLVSLLSIPMMSAIGYTNARKEFPRTIQNQLVGQR